MPFGIEIDGCNSSNAPCIQSRKSDFLADKVMLGSVRNARVVNLEAMREQIFD